MTRTVFYGLPAFVGTITGPTTCSFWPDDPAHFRWAPHMQIAIDLGKNPHAARTGKIQIAEIEADDYIGYAHGGLTKIGPMWPGGTMNGAVWVESNHWDKLGGKGHQPPRVPSGHTIQQYELTSVLYWDGDLKGRRFQGVHAEIHSVQGPLALTSIWNPGTSHKGPPIGTYWLDLSTVAHPVEQGFTEISTDAKSPKLGALFLDTALKDPKNTAGPVIVFDGPKVPRWLGGVTPRRHHVVR